MNPIMKLFINAHVGIYRLTGGKIGGNMGSKVLLLSTVGRKSGVKRTTPLMYLQDGDTYIIAASAGGADKHPSWYWNAAKGSGPVEIQVMDKVMPVDVTDAQGEQRDELYARFKAMSSNFAEYEKKADRTIPVLILSPAG